MDGRPNHTNKPTTFLNSAGVMWTGPKQFKRINLNIGNYNKLIL